MDSTESISEYLGCDLKNLPNLRPNIMRKNINDYSIYKEVYGDRVYELYKNDYILFDYEF
jgi:L-rhamnose mutarotase